MKLGLINRMNDAKAKYELAPRKWRSVDAALGSYGYFLERIESDQMSTNL